MTFNWRPDAETRAAAVDAFMGEDPPAITYAECDKRITRALRAAGKQLREKAGLEEGRPEKKS